LDYTFRQKSLNGIRVEYGQLARKEREAHFILLFQLNTMNKSVLIFDDDAEILQVCIIILEQQGYLVTTRTNCNEVTRDVDIIRPGIVLMDLWIPETGGSKAILLLKAEPARAHIPVILFSANAQIDEIALSCGADGFLKKPFEIDDLLKILEKNLA
jgi:DNA-binding NtrC family response regulator